MLIKIVLFIIIAYFVIVGMIATYFVTLSKDEEKRRNEP